MVKITIDSYGDIELFLEKETKLIGMTIEQLDGERVTLYLDELEAKGLSGILNVFTNELK